MVNKYVCTKCKEIKTKEDMSIDGSRRFGISSWCKNCRKTNARKWKAKNPEKYRLQLLKRKKNKLDYLTSRNNVLKTRYGLSLKDYERMLKLQNYKCLICGKDSKKMTYHLHVDHNHKTKVIRGLLCAPCNVYLGYIKDNINIYKNAIKYLSGIGYNKK